MNRHFHENGERVFFVTAMCPSGKPDQGTVELFGILAGRLYRLYRRTQTQEGAGLGSGELVLREFLSNEEINRGQIEDMFGRIGVKSEGVWRLAILIFQDPVTVPKNYRASLFRRRHRDALTCVADGQIVILAQSSELGDHMVSELTSLAKSHGGSVGLSSQFTDVAKPPSPSGRPRSLFAWGRTSLTSRSSSAC